MPRPSLSEVLDGLWLHASHILRPVMGEQSSEYVAMAEDYTDLRSRLSALEQELEGYRKGKTSGHETPDEERNETWLVASLREAQAEAAKFPAWTREIPAAVDRQYRPWAVPPQTSGTPCTSEYLSAQTGFNGEEGG